MILVTKKRKVGSLHGNSLYTITETLMFPVTYKARVTAEETRYKTILQNLDLSKNFFFSYTYDLTSTFQKNITFPKGKWFPATDMFIWNSFALKPILDLENSAEKSWSLHRWTLPVIHGVLKQRKFRLICGQNLKFTLIARRSRYKSLANVVLKHMELTPDLHITIQAICWHAFPEARGQ